MAIRDARRNRRFKTVVALFVVLSGPALIGDYFARGHAARAYAAVPACATSATDTQQCKWTGHVSITDAHEIRFHGRRRLFGHTRTYPMGYLAVHGDIPGTLTGAMEMQVDPKNPIYMRALGISEYAATATVWHREVIELDDGQSHYVVDAVSPEPVGWLIAGIVVSLASAGCGIWCYRRKARQNAADLVQLDAAWDADPEFSDVARTGNRHDVDPELGTPVLDKRGKRRPRR
jgi:hypothetical protein